MKQFFIFLIMSLSLSANAALRVLPGSISGFENYPEELDRIHQAFKVIEVVLNSNEFKERVLIFKGYNNQGFTGRRGMSHEEIFAFIMQGEEIINGKVTSSEMNFDIQRHYFGWYYRKKVVAETVPQKSNLIKVSEWFYARMNVAEMAGNITHEWTHLLGFSHRNAKDKTSVPYAVGEIVQKLSQKLLDQGYLN